MIIDDSYSCVVSEVTSPIALIRQISINSPSRNVEYRNYYPEGRGGGLCHRLLERHVSEHVQRVRTRFLLADTYTGKGCAFACMCMCEWLRKMAMDRTMYGKVEPGDIYQPYRITMKKGSPPGCKSDIFWLTLLQSNNKSCKSFFILFIFFFLWKKLRA